MIHQKLKLLILQGIPASGKSTWAREFLKGKENWVKVSRDDLRNMRGDYWIPAQEKFITNIEDYITGEALFNDYHVLIDATNLNPRYKTRWERFAECYDAEIEYKFFPVTLEEAIERDSKRTAKVGEDVIKRFYNQLKDELPNY